MYFSMIDGTENYNYLLCKENIFTIDLWWCKDNYFQYYIAISNSCFVNSFFPQISMVVCVFVLLFICTVILSLYNFYM